MSVLLRIDASLVARRALGTRRRDDASRAPVHSTPPSSGPSSVPRVHRAAEVRRGVQPTRSVLRRRHRRL